MFDEPEEMSQASQIILEIDAAGLASLKEMASWTHLHENTVRDYRDGRIRHFGVETRFWNGIVNGLLRKYAPAIPPMVLKIGHLLFQNSPLCVVTYPHCQMPDLPLPAMLRAFSGIARAGADAADSVISILADGKVDRADDPNIDELNQKLDAISAWCWQVKHQIAKQREGAAAK